MKWEGGVIARGQTWVENMSAAERAPGDKLYGAGV